MVSVCPHSVPIFLTGEDIVCHFRNISWRPVARLMPAQKQRKGEGTVVLLSPPRAHLSPPSFFHWVCFLKVLPIPNSTTVWKQGFNTRAFRKTKLEQLAAFLIDSKRRKEKTGICPGLLSSAVRKPTDKRNGRKKGFIWLRVPEE